MEAREAPQPDTYDVPEEVGQPVGGGAHSTDKLEVLGLVHSLLDQVKDKAGWDKGHGKNNTDSNHGIHGRGQPAAGQEIQGERGEEGEQMQEKTESGSGEAHPVLGLSLQNPLPSPMFVISFNCLKVGQG